MHVCMAVWLFVCLLACLSVSMIMCLCVQYLLVHSQYIYTYTKEQRGKDLTTFDNTIVTHIKSRGTTNNSTLLAMGLAPPRLCLNLRWYCRDRGPRTHGRKGRRLQGLRVGADS